MLFGKAVFSDMLRQSVFPLVDFQHVTVKFTATFPFSTMIQLSFGREHAVIKLYAHKQYSIVPYHAQNEIDEKGIYG